MLRSADPVADGRCVSFTKAIIITRVCGKSVVSYGDCVFNEYVELRISIL